MWVVPSRQFQQLWNPVIQTIGIQFNPAIPINGVLHKLFHALSIPSIQKVKQFAQTQILSPIVMDQPQQLLLQQPIVASPMINQTCGFKLKRVLKRRCKDCYYVVRQNRLHVICKTHPRHKQMAITRPEKSTVILTHATQSKIRPW